MTVSKDSIKSPNKVGEGQYYYNIERDYTCNSKCGDIYNVPTTYDWNGNAIVGLYGNKCNYLYTDWKTRDDIWNEEERTCDPTHGVHFWRKSTTHGINHRDYGDYQGKWHHDKLNSDSQYNSTNDPTGCKKE